MIIQKNVSLTIWQQYHNYIPYGWAFSKVLIPYVASIELSMLCVEYYRKTISERDIPARTNPLQVHLYLRRSSLIRLKNFANIFTSLWYRKPWCSNCLASGAGLCCYNIEVITTEVLWASLGTRGSLWSLWCIHLHHEKWFIQRGIVFLSSFV